jgi:leucyl-tRNA synthetase
MSDYDPQEVERRWQRRWDEEQASRAGTPGADEAVYYCLEMLPYPSGKLHMGHVRNYSIGDAMARFHRMRGRHVMHVIGWDSFGMPAENAAIQRGEDPARWTRQNVAMMRGQLQRLGLSYDWSREISTCEPEFYRWNQWFFLKMLERGLAYRDRRALNWCPSCETVLANEQVVGGRCWRCDGPIQRREFEQWFLRVTDYAEELLREIEGLDAWPERVRTMQRNWIGRSEGASIRFAVKGAEAEIEVFTTRLDTIFGATYVALAAEHPLIGELMRGKEREAEVAAFVREQLAKSLEERFAEGARKSGVDTGLEVVHPYSGETLPLWVANFVLMDVGTGAIMSVPAHDQRDFDFAREFGLALRPVIRPEDGETPVEPLEQAIPLDGILFDSGKYDGLTSAEARRRMAADAGAAGFGDATVVYRLKDWGISRQRYWGTPIPVVHCGGCGAVGLSEDDLPVLLPLGIELTGEGGSPLAAVESFVNVSCPRCGKPARRETDTMDTFVDSSWYYFRYLDPHNDRRPFDPEAARPWTPVDLYIGGIEHATLHLIYTRFWTKMMRDLGLLSIDEPVTQLFTQGMVIKDGAKMSKSKGNVVDPDEMISRYGADTTRLFCLFAAPAERDLDWSEAGVEGCHRFLKRVWRVYEAVAERLPQPGSAAPAGVDAGQALALRRKTHRTIERVTVDIGERMHLNTPVAAVMELINAAAPLADRDDPDPADLWSLREAFETLALLLAPFAPHFCEELWSRLGGAGLVSHAAWPLAAPALLQEDEVTVVVQVNGKLRARLTVPRGAEERQVRSAAEAEAGVAAQLAGKTVRRAIFVPDKLLNLVVS